MVQMLKRGVLLLLPACALAADPANLAELRRGFKNPADDARIVTWVNNGFCALAVGDDKSAWGVGWSWGGGATNIEARDRALGQCRQRTAGARIVLCVCSTNVRPEVNK